MSDKKWIELTDEYAASIKDCARRKIRLQNGKELFTTWIAREKCFYHDPSDSGYYMDDKEDRPTHILARG